MLFTGRLLSSLRRATLLREFIISWLLVGMLIPAQAAAPTWWSDRGIIHPTKPADDYAALNQGQLKNLVKAAVAEMNANLIGGAGNGLNTMVSDWTTSPEAADDYAVVNTGQLKTLALPLYQRLLSAGVITALPTWTFANDPAADDFAVANIGQAKNLFSFSIPVQETTLPVESPFVIKYKDWKSGQIRPGRGEPGDPPEIKTIYTGTKRSFKWVAGQQVTQVPTKQYLGSASVTEFDSQSAADTWKAYNHYPGEYLRHTNVVETESSDESGYGYIKHYRETYRENGSETNPDSARTLLASQYVNIGTIQNHPWFALTNVVEYEVTSDAAWTEANVTSAAVAAHWFSQVAAGPASQPVTGWAAEPVTAAANVIARLTDPGPVIPYQDLPLPTAGGVVATAHSALSSVQQTYQNAQGQTVTTDRFTGERSQGFVSIAWRQDASLTDLQKQEWLSRYIVVKKTTTTGQSPPTFTSLPLSDYLTPGIQQSHFVWLSPVLQSGVEQEIEFSVVFLDNPVTPPFIMQANNTQQSVGLGMTSPLPLSISLTQLGAPAPDVWVTLEVFSGEGGVRQLSAGGGAPQSSIMVQTNSQGYVWAQFQGSSTPGYTWLRASASGAVSQWFLMTVGGGGSGEFPENPTGHEDINFKHDSDDDGDSDADEIVAGTDPKDASDYIPDWKFRSMNMQFQTQYDLWSTSTADWLQAQGQHPPHWFTLRNKLILGTPTNGNYEYWGPVKPAVSEYPTLTPYLKPEPDSPGWKPENQRTVQWTTSPSFNPFPMYMWEDVSLDDSVYLFSSSGEANGVPADGGIGEGNFPLREWISSAVKLELRSSKPRRQSFSALAVVERRRHAYTGVTTDVVDSFALTLPAEATSSEPIVLSYEPVIHCADFYDVKYVPVEFNIYPVAKTGYDKVQISADSAEQELAAVILVRDMDPQSPAGSLTEADDGTVIEWEIIDGNGNLSTEQSLTENGIAVTTLTTTTTPGDSYKIKARVTTLKWNGGTFPLNADGLTAESDIMEVIPGKADSIVVTKSKNQYASDATDTVDVEILVKDEQGNVLEDGTPVTWILDKSTGGFARNEQNQELIESELSSGKAKATLQAPTMPVDQNLVVIVDGFTKEIPMTVNRVTGTITSNTQTLDIHLGGNAAITVNTDAADGTPVYWFASNGQITPSEGSITNGQATATLITTNGRIGDSVVTATIGDRMLLWGGSFISSAPVQVSFENPILIGGIPPGSGLPVGGPEENYQGPWFVLSKGMIKAPGFGGYPATVTLASGSSLVQVIGLDGNNQITLDQNGYAEFEIAASGELNQFGRVNVQVQVNPPGADYVEIVEITPWTHVGDFFGGLIGLDTSTPTGMVSSVIGGYIIIGDVGVIVKNAVRHAGWSDKEPNNLELVLGGAGLLGTFSGPGDGIVTFIRTIIQRLGNTPLADVLWKIAKKIITIGKMPSAADEALITVLKNDNAFAHAAANVLTDDKLFEQGAKGLAKLGQNFTDAVKNAATNPNVGRETAQKLVSTVGELSDDVLDGLKNSGKLDEALAGMTKLVDGNFVDPQKLSKTLNNAVAFSYSYKQADLLMDVNRLLTNSPGLDPVGLRETFKQIGGHRIADGAIGYLHNIRSAAHLAESGKPILKLEPPNIRGADILADGVAYNVKLTAKKLENKVVDDTISYLTVGLADARRLGVNFKIILGSGQIVNLEILRFISAHGVEVITVPFSR